MIVGLGLVVAILSYLAYLHLSGGENARHGSARGSSSSSGSGMWPFVSTLLRPKALHSDSCASATDSKSPAGAFAAPRLVPHVAMSNLPSLAEPLDTDDNDATPKALAPTQPPTSIAIVPDISLDDDDGLPPPSFPAANSAQRASGPASSVPGLMLPPPLPNRGGPSRPSPAAMARAPLSSPAARSRLAVVGAGAAGVAAGGGLTLPNGRKSPGKSKSRKVILEPGHSPLDWARLQKSGVDLRGLGHSNLIKVPPSLLAQHKSAPADIWMALDGRVYNITAYIPFHPGGDRELLRAAGKDGSKLVSSTHPWVNVKDMLNECLIGLLVSEDEASPSATASELENVD